MNFYDAFKEIIGIVQKMGNVDLTQKLFGIQQQAFELQEENYRLRTQIRQMEENLRTESEIERHPQPYITFIGDKNQIPYCATCWEVSNRKIQMTYERFDRLLCPSCGVRITKEIPKPYHSKIEPRS